MSEVAIVRGPAEVAEAAAELFTEASAGAAAARGRALVALTGGTSAPPLFGALRSDQWRPRIPWDSMEFFFTDERAVPPDHEWSNYGMAHRELLQPLKIAGERVHRLRGEAPDLAAEAAGAAADLRRFSAGGAPPRLDLVLLGLGPDGHICSLFAGTEEAARRGDDELFISVAAPQHVEPKVPRVTMTPAPVLLARTVVLCVTGAKRADVLARALKGPEDLKSCPAQWLRRAHGRVVIVCDAAAAAKL